MISFSQLINKIHQRKLIKFESEKTIFFVLLMEHHQERKKERNTFQLLKRLCSFHRSTYSM